jgi:hypothetical protein
MAALALAGNMLVCLGRGMPVPAVHDEFSYLLAADTFAHGRWTNPTPPLWQHFETFHELMRPTYQSQYPMGQGLMLALGQVLGHPALGLWLEGALLSGGLCWMLLAWLPRAPAVGVSLLMTATFGVLTYWTQSYWGGALAGLGGVLVFGGLRRVLTSGRARDAAWMALGLVILMHTRPYESLFLALPAGGYLLAHLGARRRRGWAAAGRILAPLGLILAAGLGLMAYDNFRVTGSPWKAPHALCHEQYEVVPVFWWQPLRTAPVYHNATMQHFHQDWERREAGRQYGAMGRREVFLRIVRRAYPSYGYPLLALCVLTAPYLWRDRWLRLALVCVGAMVVAHLLASHYLPHYSAPGFGLLVVLEASAAAALWQARGFWRWPGRVVVAGVVGVFLVVVGGRFVHETLVVWRAGPASWPQARVQVAQELEARGGRHLVLVRYGPEYGLFAEWVSNGADFAAAPVLWARDLGPARDAELLAAYPQRRAWLLFLNHPGDSPILRPYPASAGAEPAARGQGSGAAGAVAAGAVAGGGVGP